MRVYTNKSFKCTECGNIVGEYGTIVRANTNEYFCPICKQTIFTSRHCDLTLTEDLQMNFNNIIFEKDGKEIERMEITDNKELIFHYKEK